MAHKLTFPGRKQQKTRKMKKTQPGVAVPRGKVKEKELDEKQNPHWEARNKICGHVGNRKECYTRQNEAPGEVKEATGDPHVTISEDPRR